MEGSNIIVSAKEMELHCISIGVMSILNWHINAASPSAAYMRQWIGSALVQIMACYLFGTKPLSEPVLCSGLVIVNWTLRTNFNEILKQDAKLSIHKYTSENIVHTIANALELHLSCTHPSIWYFISSHWCQVTFILLCLTYWYDRYILRTFFMPSHWCRVMSILVYHINMISTFWGRMIFHVQPLVLTYIYFAVTLWYDQSILRTFFMSPIGAVLNSTCDLLWGWRAMICINIGQHWFGTSDGTKWEVSALRPKQNGWQIADDSLKYFYFEWNVLYWVKLQLSLFLTVQFSISHHWFR